MDNVGIYRIQIGPYYYLGQSQDLKKRKREHVYYLKKGTHHNNFMQRVYDKYQEYEFKTMIECDIDQLNHLEQSALDIHCGYDDCMNIAKDAEATWRGLNHSEESKSKMSEAKTGEKHPKYNHTLYTFIHDENGEVTTTQHELLSKYHLDKGNLSRLISGKYKSHKGWRLK